MNGIKKAQIITIMVFHAHEPKMEWIGKQNGNKDIQRNGELLRCHVYGNTRIELIRYGLCIVCLIAMHPES